MPTLPDPATLARRYEHILAVLQDSAGDWIELQSCADAVEAICHIVSGGCDHVAPTFEDPEELEESEEEASC
jgi:hypothetical protein